MPGDGQSGGESRIFRHAHDDPRLVALAVESRERWRAWEERFGVELVAPVGAVALGPAVERRFELLREAGVRARMVDAAERAADPRAGGTGAARRGRRRDPHDHGRRARSSPRSATRVVADEVVELAPSGEVRAGGVGRDVRPRRRLRRPRHADAGRGRRPRPPGAASRPTRATPIRCASPPPLACLQDGEHGAYGDPLPGNDRYAVGLGDADPDRTTSPSACRARAAGRRDPHVLGHRAAVGPRRVRGLGGGRAVVRGRQQPLQARAGARAPARCGRARGAAARGAARSAG